MQIWRLQILLSRSMMLFDVIVFSENLKKSLFFFFFTMEDMHHLVMDLCPLVSVNKLFK